MAVEFASRSRSFLEAAVKVLEPYPDHLGRVAEIKPTWREIRVSNLPESEIWNGLAEVIEKQGVMTMKKLRDLGVKKLDFLTFYVNFCNTHQAKVRPEIFPTKEISKYVGEIQKKWLDTGRAQTINEQLELALEVNDGDLTKSLLVLASASRIMARNCDSRMTPGFRVTTREMKQWKRMVAGFQINGSDNVGDTYHFWEAVVAGVSVAESEGGLYQVMSGKLCGMVYRLTEEATKIIRYGLGRQTGQVHEGVDWLGYEVGRAIRYTVPETGS